MVVLCYQWIFLSNKINKWKTCDIYIKHSLHKNLLSDDKFCSLRKKNLQRRMTRTTRLLRLPLLYQRRRNHLLMLRKTMMTTMIQQKRRLLKRMKMMTMMMTIRPLRLQKTHKRRNKSKSATLLLESLNPVLQLIHNVDFSKTHVCL